MLKKAGILLADDHPIILEGLRGLLASEFEILGTASTGRQLLDLVLKVKPDAVLLDISMPILNGIETSRQLKTLAPAVKIVFVTQKEGREFIRGAFQAGASAYCLKQEAGTQMVYALREALAGRYYISPSLRQDIPEALFNSHRNPADLFAQHLTPRQREVLQLVAEGRTGKEIASILSISAKTVEFHKAGLVQELGLRTTAELTRYAIDHGIV